VTSDLAGQVQAGRQLLIAVLNQRRQPVGGFHRGHAAIPEGIADQAVQGCIATINGQLFIQGD